MTTLHASTLSDAISLDEAAIDHRETEVSRAEQRIAPLQPEEFSDEAKALMEELSRTFEFKDTTRIPPIFRTLFKHPGVFRTHLQLGLEFNREGALPPRDRELVILRVAWVIRSPFEWGEHVDLGKRHGLTDEDITRIRIGSAAPGWDDHDHAVVSAVEELLRDYAMTDATWAVLAGSWSDKQLIELPALVASYVMTAMLYHTLRFDLLDGNRGLRHG